MTTTLDGELVGGSDIVCDMGSTGELKELITAGAGEESGEA